MNSFTTNRTIQNMFKFRNKTIEDERQEKLDTDTLKKLKLIKKAFK